MTARRGSSALVAVVEEEHVADYEAKLNELRAETIRDQVPAEIAAGLLRYGPQESVQETKDSE